MAEIADLESEAVQRLKEAFARKLDLDPADIVSIHGTAADGPVWAIEVELRPRHLSITADELNAMQAEALDG